jgi:Icc protein
MTRILHLSDLHLESPPERLDPGVRERLDRSRGLVADSACDLLLLTGDLTSYGCFDRSQLVAVRRWIEGLEVPWLAIAGNHDLSANRSRGAAWPMMEAYEEMPFGRTNFGRVFGPDPVVARRLDGVTVVGVSLRDEDPDGALPVLARTLEGLEGPVLVAGHYPLVPTRERGVLASFGAAGYLDHVRDDLEQILRRSPQVVAYLCGHVHAQSATRLPWGPWQLSAGGLGPGASLGWLLEIAETIQAVPVKGGGPAVFWPPEMLGGCDPVAYHRADGPVRLEATA